MIVISAMAAIAYAVFILNISPMHITAPSSEIYHLLLNEGLYPGLEAKFSNNEIKHMEP
jgi:hypothetical protein